MKYTIIYERTEQVGKYRPIKIGLWKEFDSKLVPEHDAIGLVKRIVNYEMSVALSELRK